jgi:hypothetical protein
MSVKVMARTMRWRDECLRFIRDAPDYQLWWMGLESEHCYRQVQQWRPAAIAGDAVAAHQVGRALFRSERYRRAECYLRRAADGGIVSAASDLAELMMRRSRWDKMRAWYRRAADLARAQGLPAVEVAHYYIKARENDEAESLSPGTTCTTCVRSPRRCAGRVATRPPASTTTFTRSGPKTTTTSTDPPCRSWST